MVARRIVQCSEQSRVQVSGGRFRGQRSASAHNADEHINRKQGKAIRVDIDMDIELLVKDRGVANGKNGKLPLIPIELFTDGAMDQPRI